MSEDPEKHGFVSEMKEFLLHDKLWWMTPILLVAILFFLVAVAGSGGESGFVYDLF